MGHNSDEGMEANMSEVQNANELERKHHIDPRPLIYLRASPSEGYPAELCYRGDDNIFHVYAVSQKALANLIRQGTNFMAEQVNKVERD